MTGDKDSPGIVQLAVEDIFNTIENVLFHFANVIIHNNIISVIVNPESEACKIQNAFKISFVTLNNFHLG